LVLDRKEGATVKARTLRVNEGIPTRLDPRRGISATLLVLSCLTGAISCDGDSGTGLGTVTGQIEVTTSTTGANIDPDGFTVTIDGEQNQSIGSNGTATFSGLAAGDHEVLALGAPWSRPVEYDARSCRTLRRQVCVRLTGIRLRP
jgi:hypothetical protein